MLKAIYPGSFDPVTKGHLDIIERAAKIVDKLVVATLENPHKKDSLFTIEERKKHLEAVTKHLNNVEIDSFQGLLVDYAKKTGSSVIIRGLRAVTDFENEFQMALTNRSLNHGIETFFISTSVEYLYLSSSTIKEVAMFGGDISDMIPEELIDIVIDKYKK